MTIAGLWEKLAASEAGDERVPLRYLAAEHFKKYGRPMRVGIDAYMWIFELSQQPTRNKKYQLSNDELINRLVMSFHSRIRDLISLHLSFVFVFDGKYKAKKRRWSNNAEETNNEEEYQDPFEDAVDPTVDYYYEYSDICKRLKDDLLTGQEDFNNAPEIRIVQRLLDLWRISYINSPGESEAELGRLNSANVIDAVISNDADGFMYGVKLMLKNFSKWLADKPATQSSFGKKEKLENDWYVTPYRIEKIQETTGLDKNRIIFVACLAGNDFSGGAKDLGITRCIQLAVVGTEKFTGFTTKDNYQWKGVDFVKQLMDIYLPKERHKYIKGRVAIGKAYRDKALAVLETTLQEEIHLHGDFYFGRKASKLELRLPNDYYFMIHFFPLLAPYLFQWFPYSTNNSECIKSSYAKREEELKLQEGSGFRILPDLPQLASVFYESENDLFKLQLVSSEHHKEDTLFTYDKEMDLYINKDVQYIHRYTSRNALYWFNSPKFDEMCTFNFPIKRSIESYLVEHLTTSYLVRILMAMPDDSYTENDIYIDRFKTAIYPTKRMGVEEVIPDLETPKKTWEEEQYMVRYSVNNLFLKYFTTETGSSEFKTLIQEELTQTGKDEKASLQYIWIPKYLLEISAAGLRLIEDYKIRETKKLLNKEAKRTTTKKTETQKNNLMSMGFIKSSTKADSNSTGVHDSPIKAPNNASYLDTANDSAIDIPHPTPHVVSPFKNDRVNNLQNDMVRINPRNLNTPLAHVNEASPSKRRSEHHSRYSSSEEDESDDDGTIFIDNTPLIAKEKEKNIGLFVSDDEDIDNPFIDGEENGHDDFLSSAKKLNQTAFFTPKKSDRIRDINDMSLKKEKEIDTKDDVNFGGSKKIAYNSRVPISRRSPKKKKELPKDQRKIDDFFKRGKPIEFFKKKSEMEVIELNTDDDDDEEEALKTLETPPIEQRISLIQPKAKTVQERLNELSSKPRKASITISSDDELDSDDPENEANEREIERLLGMEI